MKQGGSGLPDVSGVSVGRCGVLQVSVQMVSDAGVGDLHQLWTAIWDPHDHSRLLTAGGSNIQVHVLAAGHPSVPSPPLFWNVLVLPGEVGQHDVHWVALFLAPARHPVTRAT